MELMPEWKGVDLQINVLTVVSPASVFDYCKYGKTKYGNVLRNIQRLKKQYSLVI